MMLARCHAERPGHVPCVPGDGRPAQGVMRPHAPQAAVRPNQALRRLPRQGPPLPDTAAAWAAPWRPREPGRSRDIDPQVELHRTARHQQWHRHLKRGQRQRHAGEAAVPLLTRRIELGEVGVHLLHTPQTAAAAGSSRGRYPGLCRALGTRSEDAKLVALGIAQHLPAPASVDIVGPGGAEGQGLLDCCGDITAAHVQMQTVLACFRLGHWQEIERQALRGVQRGIALGMHLDRSHRAHTATSGPAQAGRCSRSRARRCRQSLEPPRSCCAPSLDRPGAGRGECSCSQRTVLNVSIGRAHLSSTLSI